LEHVTGLRSQFRYATKAGERKLSGFRLSVRLELDVPARIAPFQIVEHLIA
jgi:hypothetical protein